MRRVRAVASAGVCLLGLGAWAQQPSPDGQPAFHLKTTTREVVVDVSVTDGQGHPVHGLTRQEFSLLEGSAPQQVRGFAEHSGMTPEQRAKVPPMPQLPKGIYSNFSPVQPGETLNILLIDTLNTATSDQAYVREQLKKYLATAKPGERIAIFGLGEHLMLLQGFTTDPAVLRAIVEKKNPAASALLDDPNGTNVDANPGMQTLEGMSADDPALAGTIANFHEFDGERQAFQTQMRVEYTLDAMNELARYLASMPGRKNLIWFSGAFPLSILPDGDQQANPFAISGSNNEEYRETVNLLARAQVAVYPVDAAGLQVSPVYSAASSNRGQSKGGAAYGDANRAFLAKTAAAHATMTEMANETGGQAFLNTNDLAMAVRSAVENGEEYYTLTYSPSDMKADGAYRKITVKLDKPYQLAYRRGYYADDANAARQTPAAMTQNAAPARNTATASMMRGAPTPQQITIKVMAKPSKAEPSMALANGMTLAATKVTGPFRNYEITIAANTADVAVPLLKDGDRFAALEFVAFVYDVDGNLIALRNDMSRSEMSAQEYEQLRQGIYWQQEVSVPAKGQYFIRLGVHDMLTDHMGGVEIPTSSLVNLAPVDPPAQPAAK